MQSAIAFQRNTSTHLIAATTSASTGVQVTDSVTDVSQTQYRVYNEGPNSIAIAFGATAALAQAAAVYPTAGNPRDVQVIAPGLTEILTAPSDQFFSVITGTGTASVFIASGKGL